jgi:hypothetical protein
VENSAKHTEQTCTFAFEVQIRRGYVFVSQSGYPAAEGKVLDMQYEIERAMSDAGLGGVVFDNRKTETPPPWVRAVMWSWLGSQPMLARVALIQQDDASRQRSMDRATRAWNGISMSWTGRIQIMAFLELADAEAWILSTPLGFPAP